MIRNFAKSEIINVHLYEILILIRGRVSRTRYIQALNNFQLHLNNYVYFFRVLIISIKFKLTFAK